MKSISGPINIIRLEGHNKILYLCADIHNTLNKQTECDDIRSINITNFIIDTLDEHKKNNPNMIFDMFVERDPLQPHYIDSTYKGRYFDELVNIFNRGYMSMPNCRFHYFDIRSYFVSELKEYADGFNSVSHMMWRLGKFSVNKLIMLKDCLTIMKTFVLETYDIIYAKRFTNKMNDKLFFSQHKNILLDHTDQEYKEATKKLFKKIFDNYNNKHIKQQINKITEIELDKEFIDVFKFYDINIQYLNGLIGLYNNNGSNSNNNNNQTDEQSEPINVSLEDNLQILSKIKLMASQLYDMVYGKSSMMITDLYFLRRFLDKSYVTNSLLYAGEYHIMNTIYLLVKYFDFKVTHYSYFNGANNNSNYTDINDIIKQTTNYGDLKKYFHPQRPIQCSIYNQKFPPLFL